MGRSAGPPDRGSVGKRAFVAIHFAHAPGTTIQALLDTGNLARANFLPLSVAVRCGIGANTTPPSSSSFSSAVGKNDIRSLGSSSVITSFAGYLVPVVFEITDKIELVILSNEFMERSGTVMDYSLFRASFHFGSSEPVCSLPLCSYQTDLLGVDMHTVACALSALRSHDTKESTNPMAGLRNGQAFATGIPPLGSKSPFVFDGLTAEQGTRLRELADEFSDVFRDIGEGTRGIQKDGRPFLTTIPLRKDFIPRPRPSPAKAGPLHKLVVERYVKKKVLEATTRNPPFVNPWFLVEKKNKALEMDDPAKYRLVVNPAVNGGVINGSRSPDSPEIQASRLCQVNGRFMMSTDGSDQFFQFLLKESSRMLCCITANGVVYHFVCLIQGMTNSSSVVQSANDWMFRDSIALGLEAFIDNYALACDDFDVFVSRVRTFFTECRSCNLRLNAKDTFLGFPTIVHVGMEVSRDGFAPAIKHSQGIMDFINPGKVPQYDKSKQLASNFVNCASIWMRFIASFEPSASVLRDFSLGKAVWSKAHNMAFKHLQGELTSRRVMRPFCIARLTAVRFDAGRSTVCPERHYLAGCLLQEYDTDEGKICFPVAFASRLMTPAEEESIQGKLTTVSTRMEAMAGAFCCDRWFHWLRVKQVFYLWPDSANLNHTKTATSEFMLAFFGFLLARFHPGQVAIASDRRYNNVLSDLSGRGSTAEINPEHGILLTIRSSLGGIAKPTIPANARLPSKMDPAVPPAFFARHFSRQESDKLKRSKSYVIRNNAWVYVKPGGSFGQMLVPHKMQNDFLAWCHTGRNGSHLTLKDTKAKAEAYYFPGIVKAIAEHFSACSDCQVAVGSTSRRHVVTGLSVQASYYGEIVMVDFKEFAGLLFVSIMDSCTRHVVLLQEPDKSLSSAKHAWLQWSQNGVRVRFLYSDKEKSLTCEDFKVFVGSFDGTILVPSKGRDPEHIAALERFHKELGVEERKIASDELALAELPNILRRWHQSFEGKTHVSRADSTYGADPLFAKLALRQSVLTERSTSAARQHSVQSLEFVVGDRVKVLAHNPQKRDPLYRLAEILAIRPGTALLRWEDTGEEQEVNVREIMAKIGKPSTEVLTPMKDDTIMVSGPTPSFFLVVSVDSKTCRGHLLLPVNSRLGVRKRVYRPKWHISETASVLSVKSPSPTATRVTEVISYSDILAVGLLKANGRLSSSLTQAYTTFMDKARRVSSSDSEEADE